MARDTIGEEFSSAEFYDAANAIPHGHSPWRRAVAAAIALMFTATLVLIGLICTTGRAVPAPASASNSFART